MTQDSGPGASGAADKTAHEELIPIVGAVSDKGIRSENQDRMSRTEVPAGELLIVADGVGGHVGGATAAKLTIETVEKYLRAAQPDAEPPKALQAAIEEANRVVYEAAHSGDPNFHEMASTVVALLLKGKTAFIAHVGDSRAYLLRASELRPLTRDHSQIQELIDKNLITAEEAADHPDSNTITRAIGNKSEVEVEAAPPAELAPDDVILLCSDGLHGYVKESAILETIRSSASPQEAAENLVKMASSAGSRDNITVQLAQFRSSIRGTAAPTIVSRDEPPPKRPRWRPVAAGIAALAVATLGYTAYKYLRVPGPPPVPASNISKELSAGLAQIRQLEVELASAQQNKAAAAKKVADLISSEAALAKGAATSAATAATRVKQEKDRADAAKAQVEQAKQAQGESQKRLSEISEDVKKIEAEIVGLEAKTDKSQEEQEALTAANTKKTDLAAKHGKADQESKLALVQLKSKEDEAAKAKKAWEEAKKVAAAPTSDQKKVEIAKQLDEARNEEKQAAESVKTLETRLTQARDERDRIIKAQPTPPADAPSESSANPQGVPTASKAPSMRLLILETKPDDPLAKSLREHLARSLPGVDVQVVRSSSIEGTGGNRTGSARLFYARDQTERDRAKEVEGTAVQVEPILREFLSKERQAAAKVSVVITPATN